MNEQTKTCGVVRDATIQDLKKKLEDALSDSEKRNAQLRAEIAELERQAAEAENPVNGICPGIQDAVKSLQKSCDEHDYTLICAVRSDKKSYIAILGSGKDLLSLNVESLSLLSQKIGE